MTYPKCRPALAILTLLVGILFPLNADAAPGDLYVTDQGSGTAFKFASDGTKTSFVSGLIAPVGLAFDGKGNVFIGDTGSATIVKVAPDGTQSVFAVIQNDGPIGMAFDAAGNLYVGLFNGGVVLKITPAGTQSTFASGLGNPTGLAFDKDGNLFAADLGGGISKITPTGVTSSFATGLMGTAGLAFDGAGNLFAADNTDGAIYKFTPDGTRSTIASGVSGAVGVVFDSAGNLYVASNLDGTILKFTPAGVKSTFASGLAQSTLLAFEPAPEKLLNVSARALVQSGDNVLIGGFIVGGSSLLNNFVVVRALGPSLSRSGVTTPLPDPTLELRDASGAIIAANDNWQDTQKTAILASGLAPADTHESAILTRLPAGAYTAIVRSANDATGIALVEIYNVP